MKLAENEYTKGWDYQASGQCQPLPGWRYPFEGITTGGLRELRRSRERTDYEVGAIDAELSRRAMYAT